MGLDMYLVRKHYIWSDERKGLKITGSKHPIDGSKVSYIVEEAGYWRKANAIHNWFVNNVQNGEDDCGDYYVSKEQLTELRDLCKQVLAGIKVKKGKVKNGQRSTENGWEDIMEDGEFIENPEFAHELLPTTSGFFFGSTEYDQWYIRDLEETVKIIDEALANDSGDFEYHSSW